jgi:hypothetical protein
MPENPPDQGEACPGGQGTAQRRDEASQWRRIRLKGPLRRIQLDCARPARGGGDSAGPIRTSVVDDMKMTEALEPD